MNTSAAVLTCAALPVLIQAIALSADEFVFHRRRGLARWERIGHPLDTLSVIVPVAIAVILPIGLFSLVAFFVSALLSCFFVTKDEWIHARECNAVEHWLHSVLFICHPLVFVSTAILWSWRDAPHVFGLDAQLIPAVMSALYFQTLVLVSFGLYQVIYWNIVRRPVSDSAARWKLQGTKSESADPQSCVSATE